MANLGSLVADLVLKDAEFNRNLTQAGRNVKSFASTSNKYLAKTEQQWGQVEKAARSFTGGVFDLEKMLGAISVGGLAYAAKASLDVTEELQKNATMAGVSIEAYQELSYAAQQYSITQDSLTDGLKELSLRGDEFVKEGAGPAKDAFERLGYSAADVNKLLDDTPGLLSDIISRMEGLDKAAQIRIADEIFGGTGGEQFVAMIQGGSMALDGMRQSAHDLGVVIDDDMVKQSVKAKRQVEQLTTVLSAQFTSVVAELAPDIAEMSTSTLEWVKANKDLIDQGMDVVVNGIGDAFDFVERTISKTNTAMEKLIGLYDKLPKGLINKESINKFIDAQYAEGKDVKEMIARLKAGVLDKPDVILRPITGDYTPGLPKNNDPGHDPRQRGSGGGGDGTKKLSKEAKDLIDANLEGWFNDVDQAAQRYVDLFEEGAQVTLAMRTPTEQLADETARLNGLLDVGAINAETFGRAMAQAQEDIKGSAVDADLEAFFSDIDAESERLAEKTTSDWENAFSGWATGYASELNDMLWEQKLNIDDITVSLGKMATQWLLNKAITESMNFAFGGFGSIFSGIFHDGGVVGSGDGGSRAVSPIAFAGAPRFHSGLMPDEFAAILQRGETVFTENQTKALGAMISNKSKGGDAINVHFNITTDNPQSFNRSRGEIESKMVSTLRRARRRSG